MTFVERDDASRIITVPDGLQVRREGQNTESARRQADGRWLFVIDNPSVPAD